LHFFALYCTRINFKHQGDLSLMWFWKFAKGVQKSARNE
jgi:hypothetical protein